MEPNGQLNILKKSEKEQVTHKDINIKGNPVPYIPAEIIVDGKLVEANM